MTYNKYLLNVRIKKITWKNRNRHFSLGGKFSSTDRDVLFIYFSFFFSPPDFKR